MRTPQEVNAEIRQLVEEHPDLPVMVLAPSTTCEFDSYWHDATGARIAWLLYPTEVQGEDWHDSSRYVGLSYERFYSDEDEAIEDVSDCLWDVWLNTATAHGMYAFAGETFDEPRTASPDDVLTTFCGYDLGESLADMCDDVAREMVRAMPWHETIVIDCC